MGKHEPYCESLHRTIKSLKKQVAHEKKENEHLQLALKGKKALLALAAHKDATRVISERKEAGDVAGGKLLLRGLSSNLNNLGPPAGVKSGIKQVASVGEAKQPKLSRVQDLAPRVAPSGSSGPSNVKSNAATKTIAEADGLSQSDLASEARVSF